MTTTKRCWRHSGYAESRPKRAVGKIDNILNNFKDSDITGTLKDMAGNPVPKPDGGYWDHLKKMNDTLRGLRNHAETLKGCE
ncbi:polymorphic toxin type 28 domain-containing protein [Pseudomonas viridiflava]|uniref:polymorphic toxin type 28 domain-containing protein n=1 Tax=Pseudomonas viridiflava TaxID=33069 RepID=UPI0018CC5B6D